MKREKKNNAVGVAGRSGRKSIRQERDYFSKLDKCLPETIDFLMRVVRRGEVFLDMDEGTIGNALVSRERIDFALKAAKILNDRAPQRVQGTGESGEIILKVVGDYKL